MVGRPKGSKAPRHLSMETKAKLQARKELRDIPKNTELSKKISKKMKELGFSFCGPVTVYSFMQASGIVNDHLMSCPHYLKCQKD